MNAMTRAWTLLAALILVLTASPALAEERITQFISDVHVQPDGVLDVTETIRLESEGVEIKRGIQRDFPTRYHNDKGRLVEVGFTVISVDRDGQAEPYKLMRMTNGQRVRIGDPNSLLLQGEHVYRIRYRTSRQLGFFKGFDELYWNATGTGWTFPIEEAEARITLPRAATFGKRAFYTGSQGATDGDAEVVSERPGQIVFRTTRRLEAEQGLTVAVAWPKGVVAEPTSAMRLGWFLREQGALILALAGVLAIILYMAQALWRARRDPDPRPITPLFAPPDDLSAAAVRHIWRGGFDDRAFTAAIVDSAVRGRLRIIQESAEKGLGSRKPGRRLQKTDGTTPLPAPEETMVKRLFKGRKSIALSQGNQPILAKAREALAEGLDADYGEDRYASDAAVKATHGWWALAGLMLLVALVLVAINAPRTAPLALGVAAAGVAAELGRRWLAKGRKGPKALKGGWRTLSLLITGLLVVAIYLLGGFLLLLGFASGDPVPLLLTLIAFPVVIVAKMNLRGPTAAGWVLRKRIAGFRHYLSIAEEDRLEKLNPPEKTAALFERYLPYAIALEVETRWAQRFARILAEAAMDPTTDQDDGWYSGDRQSWSRPAAFATAVGASLTATIASASTPPGSSSDSGSSSSSSSSGSSGGGSSGGGGGGGGGSGW